MALMLPATFVVAWIPTVTFLLAGVNHLVEVARERNFAPNITLILIWDFGMPISLVAPIFATGSI